MSQSDMSQPGLPLQTASVTDRGLNERRPLNEDSFLSDAGRRIFAVADGVGGAEAGEVASQTAIEVLDEAFRHHRDGEDIEDLMEIAIQRANSSIHQLSREHPKLSMMATTIIALHLDGLRATVGHVGDSRLYRLAPDGQLLRETEDHSMVEEEVRAGRMTPQQAANHPSRNVILRALGAEASVEVDMKVIEVEMGTTFLLCTDGITRHIPDDELRRVLLEQRSCEAACAEMKRLCFERGAEDNLTAVIIRIGEAATGAQSTETHEVWDDERTLVAEDLTPPSPQTDAASAAASPSASEPSAAASGLLQRPFHDAGKSASFNAPVAAQASANAATATATTRAGSAAGEVNPPSATTKTEAAREASPPAASAERKGGFGKTFALLLALVVVGAVAFLGGIIFQRRTAGEPSANTTAPMSAAGTAIPASNAAAASYEQRRRQVDRSPAGEAARMSAEMNGQPLTSDNPEFLYLYGRALLLSGKPTDAITAFEKASLRIDQEMTAENAQLKLETRMAAATAALQANNVEAARRAAQALQNDIKAEGSAESAASPPQGESPAGGNNSEPSP